MLSVREINNIENLLDSFSQSLVEVLDTKDNDHRIYDFIDNSYLLNSYRDLFYYKLLSIQNVNFDARILIIKTINSFTTSGVCFNDSNIQIIGIKVLDDDFGHIFIRPATFEDKINDYFQKREWNFYDFPKFSSNYYCHSKNFFLGDAFATNHRLGLIEKQNHILIEIKQDILIAKYPRDFNHLDFSNLIAFIKQI